MGRKLTAISPQHPGVLAACLLSLFHLTQAILPLQCFVLCLNTHIIQFLRNLCESRIFIHSIVSKDFQCYQKRTEIVLTTKLVHRVTLLPNGYGFRWRGPQRHVSVPFVYGANVCDDNTQLPLCNMPTENPGSCMQNDMDLVIFCSNESN